MTSNRLHAAGYTLNAKRIARLTYLLRRCEFRQGLFINQPKGTRAGKWGRLFAHALYRELERMECVACSA